tara:strand:- start:195 stop:1241 length:1047 start_codon:yes stop_codon:yes gene_type:complete
MINYFFISSPLHFCIATNLAISNKNDRNIALFISKNKATVNQYSKATKYFNTIFNETYDLSINPKKNKLKEIKSCFKKIDNIITLFPANKIFTGNDRRLEFQFTMHKTRLINHNVEGIYIDDGAISYIGHKSINNLLHKYVDPYLKKLVFGTWWKSALTTGSSSWISKAYLAMPSDAHPLLQTKELVAIKQEVFSSEEFLKVNDFLIATYNGLTKIDFLNVKVVLCLPYESLYLHDQTFLSNISKAILKNCKAEELAIKAHPRSKNISVLKENFPSSISLPNTLAMELLLPNLTDNTSIIGDVSTALLTAKWLKPNLKVEAFEINNIPTNLKILFKKLGIGFVNIKSH